MQIDVGKIIAGKYELVRLIGKGAMGEVWLATHDTLGGEFAIKLVEPSDDQEDETASGRFQLEAQVSAKLSRKTRHIASVSDHGEEDGIAYLVMELLDGESLDARIKRAGMLPLPEVVAIVSQITRALAVAHGEGIFHRDLKPANIFLTRDEDGRLLVKLLDFGIARTQKPFRTRSPYATSKDMVLGTPSYMSPEQARGLDSLDYRCDLWALAVVTYEALARAIPWDGETVEDIFLSICTFRSVPIRARRADLPIEIDAIFAKAFATKLEERFASATDFSDAFEVLVPPEAVDAIMGGRIASLRRLPSMPSYPGFEKPSEMVVTVAETTGSRKRGAGWLVAVLAALATVALVGVILLVIGKKEQGRTAITAGPEPSGLAASPSITAKPSASPLEGAPSVTGAPSAPIATAATSETAIVKPPAGGRPKAVTAPVVNVATTNPAVANPASTNAGTNPGTKPGTAPPPATSGNRSDVF